MADNRDIFVDLFGDVVADVRADYESPSISTPDYSMLEPYYMYGHYRDVNERLHLKDGNTTKKFQKFPLIYLVTDIEQKRGEYKDIAYEIPSFTVVILTPTDRTYTAPERTEETFKPILYPIYELLIEKLQENRAITTENHRIDHSQFDRYSWGAPGAYGSEGNILSSDLDAIELTINDLRVYKSEVCQ